MGVIQIGISIEAKENSGIYFHYNRFVKHISRGLGHLYRFLYRLLTVDTGK